MTAASKMARDGGRVVVIGIAAGATPAPIELPHVVHRSIRLKGLYGARAG